MNIIEMPTIGRILKEEFMDPYSISSLYLSDSIFVSISTIDDIINDKKHIDADISIRLGKFFGISNTYFLNLQNEIEVRNALEINKNQIDKINPFNKQ